MYSLFQENINANLTFAVQVTVNAILRGRVSPFSAYASDDVSAVMLIVFGPIRSEHTTPAGYGRQVLQLAGIKLIGQCFSHVSERNKKAAHVKHMGFFVTLRAMSQDFKEMPEPLLIYLISI